MISIATAIGARPARRRGAGVAALLLIAALWAGAPTASAACPNEGSREQQRSTFLPNCRAYEMVSPPEKNGGGVMTGSSKMRAAADGSAALFRSLTAFGDAFGMGVAVEYVAERSTAANPGDNGWETHAVTPAQEPVNAEWVTMGYEPGYVLVSPDLSGGVLWARNLTNDPFVEKVANLYARADLRSPGAGTYTLMSPCSLCEADATPLPPAEKVGGEFSGLPRVAGASSDMSSVLFESTLPLAPGSNAKAHWPDGIRNVYESDHGVTRLVNLVPSSGSECVDPACVVPSSGAVAGMGEFIFEHKLAPRSFSSDGMRAVFTADAAKYPCPTGTLKDCGQLYLRELGTQPARTIQINASERSSPESPQPATFWDASTDLSRVFFTSGEQLTETPGSGLYMFDAQAPAGEHLTLIGPSAERVYGVSEDGRYVYFTASTQLVAGEPALAGGASGIYLWSDAAGAPAGGEVRYIGELRDGQSYEQNEYKRFEEARVSPDGQHLLFPSISGEGLLSHYGGSDYDQENCEWVYGKIKCNELYLYDAQTNQLHCATCRPDGAPARFGSTIRSDNEDDGAAGETSIHENRALSADGRYAFFSTEESLVPQDTNGVMDVYEYDSATNEVHLISSGESADPSYFIDASASGNDVFIVTRGQLVGWDVDKAYDLYDVRVDGGFPEPPPPPPSCEGDACQPAPVVLSDATPGTLTFSGPGNMAPALEPAGQPGKKAAKHKHKHRRRTRHPKARHAGRHGKRNRGGRR